MGGALPALWLCWGHKVPYLVPGDWNMTPGELLGFDWVGKAKGVAVVPDNVHATCTTGKGRLLDYVLVHRSLARLVGVNGDMEGGWPPHMGLSIQIRLERTESIQRHLVRARPLEDRPGPRSKTWAAMAEEAEEATEKAAGEGTKGYKVAPTATSQETTQLYALFAGTAESWILERWQRKRTRRRSTEDEATARPQWLAQ